MTAETTCQEPFSKQLPRASSPKVIDATETIDAEPFSLPAKEKMDAALISWREAGLPDFPIPKRARLRIERS
jgi:hypothetical protein